MQPETTHKPVMDVKAPPAKQPGDVPAQPAPTTATFPKKVPAKQKSAGAPVMAIILTVLVMLVLGGLAVVVYMKSH